MISQVEIDRISKEIAKERSLLARAQAWDDVWEKWSFHPDMQKLTSEHSGKNMTAQQVINDLFEKAINGYHENHEKVFLLKESICNLISLWNDRARKSNDDLYCQVYDECIAELEKLMK